MGRPAVTGYLSDNDLSKNRWSATSNKSSLLGMWPTGRILMLILSPAPKNPYKLLAVTCVSCEHWDLSMNRLCLRWPVTLAKGACSLASRLDELCEREVVEAVFPVDCNSWFVNGHPAGSPISLSQDVPPIRRPPYTGDHNMSGIQPCVSRHKS